MMIHPLGPDLHIAQQGNGDLRVAHDQIMDPLPQFREVMGLRLFQQGVPAAAVAPVLDHARAHRGDNRAAFVCRV